MTSFQRRCETERDNGCPAIQPQRRNIRRVSRDQAGKGQQQRFQRRCECLQMIALIEHEPMSGRHISASTKRDVIILPRVLRIDRKHERDGAGQNENPKQVRAPDFRVSTGHHFQA